MQMRCDALASVATLHDRGHISVEVVASGGRPGPQVTQTIRVTFARSQPVHFTGVGCNKKAALRAAKEAFATAHSARIEALLSAPRLPVVYMSDLFGTWGVCAVDDVNGFFAHLGPSDVVAIDTMCIDGRPWVAAFTPRRWSLLASPLDERTENVIAILIRSGNFVKLMWSSDDVVRTLLPRDPVERGSVVDAEVLYARSTGREVARAGIARAANDMDGLRGHAKVEVHRSGTLGDLKARAVFAWYLPFSASATDGGGGDPRRPDDSDGFPRARWCLDGPRPQLADARLDHRFPRRRARPGGDHRALCAKGEAGEGRSALLVDTACVVAWLAVVRMAFHVCALATSADNASLGVIATLLVGTSVASLSCVVAVAAQAFTLAAACVDAHCIMSTTLYSQQCLFSFSNLASAYIDMWLAPFTFSILSEFRHRIAACKASELRRLRVKIGSRCAAVVAAVVLLGPQ